MVQYLRGGYRISERRACGVSQLHRGTYRYRSHKDPRIELRMRMREIATVRVRYGYRKILVLLRREGWAVGKTMISRLYREEGLALRRTVPFLQNSSQLVDRADDVDRQHGEHRRDDPLMCPHVEIGPLGHERYPGTPPTRLDDRTSGLDAASLGLRVGRDHPAIERIGERNHSDGTALQARVGLLFAGRKEAVEIDVQTLRLERFPHEPYYGEQ